MNAEAPIGVEGVVQTIARLNLTKESAARIVATVEERLEWMYPGESSSPWTGTLEAVTMPVLDVDQQIRATALGHAVFIGNTGYDNEELDVANTSLDIAERFEVYIREGTTRASTEFVLTEESKARIRENNSDDGLLRIAANESVDEQIRTVAREELERRAKATNLGPEIADYKPVEFADTDEYLDSPQGKAMAARARRSAAAFAKTPEPFKGMQFGNRSTVDELADKMADYLESTTGFTRSYIQDAMNKTDPELLDTIAHMKGTDTAAAARIVLDDRTPEIVDEFTAALQVIEATDRGGLALQRQARAALERVTGNRKYATGGPIPPIDNIATMLILGNGGDIYPGRGFGFAGKIISNVKDIERLTDSSLALFISAAARDANGQAFRDAAVAERIKREGTGANDGENGDDQG